MKDYRVTGRKRANRRIEVPIEHPTFSEDIERVVLQYYDECLSLYRHFCNLIIETRTSSKFLVKRVL
jgi:hypothetical protein